MSDELTSQSGQPAPDKDNTAPEIWPIVIEDMQTRHEWGTAKYGVGLRAHDGRNSLVDAYEEILDLAVYLRKAIYEQTEGKSLTFDPDIKLYDVKTVAEKLAVRPGTVRNWIKDGKLPGVELDGGYRVQHSDLVAFVHERYGFARETSSAQVDTEGLSYP